ncbi:hypothetical protein V6N12_005552 [Hibiscus sabdariffa]|uniref:Uncharacterized protein n=1 Tax=Hibiscus sabdariffa TaxID=183260 RepID=A0ABR1ZV07_9ROSI
MTKNSIEVNANKDGGILELEEDGPSDKKEAKNDQDPLELVSGKVNSIRDEDLTRRVTMEGVHLTPRAFEKYEKASNENL